MQTTRIIKSLVHIIVNVHQNTETSSQVGFPKEFAYMLGTIRKSKFKRKLHGTVCIYFLNLVQKDTKINQVFCLIKSSEIIFIFLPEFLPDYMAHDITKQFWKNIHFENMTAGFLLRYENLLWYFTPEMRYENRIILNKKCHSFWPN